MSINKDSQKAPNLRFKGFTDDWEQRELENLVTRVKSYSLSRSVETNSDTNTKYIHYGDIHTHVADKIEKGTKLPNIIPGDYETLNKGDLVLADASEDYQGIATPAIVMTQTDYSLVAGLHTIALRPIKIDSLYLYYLIKSSTFRKYGYKVGTGMKVFGISVNRLLEFKAFMPITEEQSKIAELLLLMDKSITLHQRKLDQLNQLKEALLQQMFPGKGETVPKLRFAGFEGDWEERKLSSMTMYKNGKSHEDKQSTSGKYELINLNSISISGGLKHSGKFVEETDDTLQKDDLVMILSDVGHGDLLGRVALIPNDNMFVLNQRVALLRSNETADPNFLFSYINAHQHYFKSQGAGMSQLNISKGSVENFTSNVPTIQEQNHIGTFFKSLDNIIVLYQGKLEQLQNMKQVLLQNMFI